MPLTNFQSEIARLLSKNRSCDSYLAGGAAFNFQPNSKRYSNDLDYFHDSVERVASAFNQDHELLTNVGYNLKIELSQPGYIKAIVSKNDNKTKIEWAHDSAWRFMPTIFNDEIGYTLHPVDLAINKLLALVGRDEPRDFLDTIEAHNNVLSLGALCWAASGKDPGYTPNLLVEMLQRRGNYHEEDFTRLLLASAINLIELKNIWRTALVDAKEFISARPASEIGCLYYSPKKQKFITPSENDEQEIKLHFGKPGGILPSF